MIEGATGFRKILLVACLFVASWILASTTTMIVGGALMHVPGTPSGWMQPASVPGQPPPSPPPPDPTLPVVAFLKRVPELAWTGLSLSVRFTIELFKASTWERKADELWLTVFLWVLFMGVVIGGTLMSLPLVGLRVRKRLSLRWSIASGGILGGLLGLGVMHTIFDMIRLLDMKGDLDATFRLFGGEWSGLVILSVLLWLGFGLMWTLALARVGRDRHPDTITRFIRRLLAGTCVELAIAAPTYAVAMRRSDCWCSWASWFSIVGGVAILTVLCGPMLVLLWTREARLQWLRESCWKCGYPLRSASAACPECGAAIRGSRRASLPA